MHGVARRAAHTPRVRPRQVEVSNTQRLSFDRGHSLWRMLLLPHGDVDLSVLTRLTLSQDHKV
jgi:hypothetical protein